MSFLTDGLELSELSKEWLYAKQKEKEAVEYRRELEDKMRSLIGVADNLDGTETAEPDGYVIKITGRINRSVDSAKLQEIAAEYGLTEHLSSLFRWKPEINATAWKSADESITEPLTEAITSKAGRPSFAIKEV